MARTNSNTSVNVNDIFSQLVDTKNSGPVGKNGKPDPMVWLNIGSNVTHPETGEVTFVSIPFGLPLDTQEPKKLQGKNEEWLQLVAAKNALLEHLQKIGDGIAPGEEEVIDGLQVQIRRRAAPAEPAAAGNNFLTGIGNIGIAPKTAESA